MNNHLFIILFIMNDRLGIQISMIKKIVIKQIFHSIESCHVLKKVITIIMS